MVKTLYLMRHGETLFNQQGRIQGFSDSPLTDKGIEQARQCARYFKEQGLAFERLYCSTLERASDTLELVTGRTDYCRLKGLKEWNFGSFEGMPHFLNPRPNEKTSHGDFFVSYGGESYEEVRQRLLETLTKIMEESNEGERVLAVSHGSAIVQFIMAVTMEEQTIAAYSMNYCQVVEFQYENGIFHMKGTFKPSE
ncbi:TPA: histidine phosphatase family protein [Streptococcus suis]